MFFIKRKIRYFVLIVLFGGSVIIWSILFSSVGNGFLEVVFFDVGQGDAIFIETSNKTQVLIDGGPDKTILEKLNKAMPFYDKSIDLLILTHPDADHITGLISVIEHYKIGHILTSGLQKDTVVYGKWRDLIEKKGIPLTLAQAGQKIILQENINMEILWPDQSSINSFSSIANNVSVVGRLVYGQIEFFLAGDIEKKVEQNLINQSGEIESDILKLAHHGSKTSSGDNFIRVINPKLAVISVGENNRYKHPDEEVLERLKDIILLRTDLNGDIKILTDGKLFDILTAYE